MKYLCENWFKFIELMSSRPLLCRHLLIRYILLRIKENQSMTVVVGANFLSEVLVIADTRVYWPDGSRPPQDIVQKLYRIRSPRTPDKEAIIGYSGDISGIKEVAQYLGKDKFEHYKRPLVMLNLKEDLRGWIEESTISLDVWKRKGLKFMLCGIEPSRQVPIRKGDKIIRSRQILETHIYVFSVNARSGKVNVNRVGDLAVIGSGATKTKELKKKILSTITFGFSQPNLHWARSVVAGEIANEIILNRDIRSIGGPLQVVRIAPDGVSANYIWPEETRDRNVEASQQGQVTILQNASSNRKYKLYPIWALPT